MTTLTVTEARKSLYSLWSAIQETLFLIGIPGMRESIQKGLRTPVG